MSKLWIVIVQEYLTVVKKKSFVIGILLTPILMAGFAVVPALLMKRASTEAEPMAIIDRSEFEAGNQLAGILSEYTLEDTEEAYYDMKGIWTPASADTVAYNAIYDSLRVEIVEKTLKYFVVIGPEAHLNDSNIFLVTNSDNFITIRRMELALSKIVAGKRLALSDVNLPIDSVLKLTTRIDLRLQDAKGESIAFEVKYFSALIFVGIMFGLIFGFGQLVMRSIIEEKNSRIMEVLVSSITPFQLMMGKVLGLGAASLTQIAIWMLLGSGLYFMKGTLNIDPSVGRILFNPAIIIFFVLFMTSGYLLFSTIFALVGSIVNTEKEAQSFLAPITLLMMVPFMLGLHVVQEPNSLLSTILSFVPLLTPTMMMMRVIFIAPTLTEYSLFSGIIGEATLGFIIVMISIVGLTWLTGKIFRIGILMYGKRPTLPEILKWIKY